MHPTDGMWREVLDSESDPPVLRELESHLATCPDCQATVNALDNQRFMVADLLDRLEVQVPLRTEAEVLGRSRSRGSRGLLAAAAIIICLVTAAGATVRPDIFHRVADWVLGPRRWLETAPTAPPAQADASTQSGIAFEPSGHVEVAFDEWQQAGEIVIVLDTDSKVSITASKPVGYSVRKGRVTVANHGARADYRLRVPRGTALTSVSVAGRVVFFKHGSTVVTDGSSDSAGTYLVPFMSKKRGLP